MEQKYTRGEVYTVKRLLVYCEGSAEESFVKELLKPYMLHYGVNVFTRGAGGISKYSIIRKELLNHCKSDKNAMITTMLDYYKFPKEAPGMLKKESDLYKKVKFIESSIEKEMEHPNNLLFNLSIHEFEAYLFSSIEAFHCIASPKQIKMLDAVCKKYDNNPEMINTHYDSIPSRQIIKIIPDYQKVFDGIRVAKDVEINNIITRCTHFARWISRLTTWATQK